MAIPKPKKPVEDPKSYHLISLICFEWLIHAVLNRLLTQFSLESRLGSDGEGQPWIRLFCSLKTRGIRLRLQKNVGAVFVDLTAAYDTVWHRGLTCKLLRILPDKYMIRIIVKLVRNRSFTLTIGDSKQSRLRRLRNGLLQESVLAPLVINIYTYDLPSMTSQQYTYADDLALLYASRDWKAVEDTLSRDTTIPFSIITENSCKLIENSCKLIGFNKEQFFSICIYIKIRDRMST